MIDQNTSKRKFASSLKPLNNSHSNSSLNRQQLKDMNRTYQSPVQQIFTGSQQLSSKKYNSNNYRQTKVNSLLPQMNQTNNATSSHIHNNSDFKYEEEDKHSNSQLNNGYDEIFLGSKDGFNPLNNYQSFSKTNATEQIKLQEKQIKHLKMMNEYYQISLKQKDQIYKMLVLENIKLKHQIQIFEQQGNTKTLSTSESHLLFKKQKVLLNEQTRKPQPNNNAQQLISNKSTNDINVLLPQQLSLEKQVSEGGQQEPENQEKLDLYQRRSSKQKLTFVFKPPRVSNQTFCEVPYKMKDNKISDNTSKELIAVPNLASNILIPDNNNNQSNCNKNNNLDYGNGNTHQHTNNHANDLSSNLKKGRSNRNSQTMKSTDLKDKKQIINSPQISSLQKESILVDTNSEEQHTNFLSVKTNKSKTIALVENFRRISDQQVFQDDNNETQSQQMNQSFFNDTPNALVSKQTIFDQLDDPNSAQLGPIAMLNASSFYPKKLEMKANFVSHSTDFAFITQLLELKSKAADNLKIYNENKSIQQIRQMLNDERNLKKTILNLSKNTFSQFYDCLLHTLESSDLFFHLTNKLKNMVSAIIKIHLSLEINEAFQKIVKECCNVLECDRASVFLVNPTTQELWTRIAKGAGVIKVPFGQGLVGFVANTMKSLNILDAHKDSRFNPEIDKKNNYLTKSVLCVPVIDPEKGNLVGVMQAINKNDGFFTKDDEGCLSIMAYHAMNVLRNSISHDQKQKNQNMVKNLLNVSIKVGKCPSIDFLLLKSRRMLQSYLDIEDIKIYFIDKEKQKLFTINLQNEREDFDMDCGVIGLCLSNKQDLMIDNAYNHTNFNQMVDINTSMPLSNYVIWDNPRKKNQIFGVVQIINQNGIHNLGNTVKTSIKFDSHLKIFCEILGSQLKKFQKLQSNHQSQINSPLKLKYLKRQTSENHQKIEQKEEEQIFQEGV